MNEFIFLTASKFEDLGKKLGYTVIELMVTVLIVSVLATTLGVGFVKLLTIQEREREEAYVRERLAEICANYADYLSVADNICTVGTNKQMIVVKYREETGGVSLETGRVARVTRLVSENKTIDGLSQSMALDLKIGSIDGDEYNKSFISRFSRLLRGDAELVSLVVDKVSCLITPLNVKVQTQELDPAFGILEKTDAALASLRLVAWYKIKNDDGEWETKTADAERVVRLWNRK